MILVQSIMQHHMQQGGTSLIPSHTNVTSPYTQPLSTSSGNSTHAMSQNAKSQQQPQAHCVVWTAPGKAPAADLMQALARRSEIEIEQYDSGFEAFAALCVRVRDAKAAALTTGNQPLTGLSSPTSSSSGGHAVLLLVEPAELPMVQCFMHAASIFANGSSTWSYDSTRQNRLCVVSLADKAEIASLGSSARVSQGKLLSKGAHTEPKLIAAAATVVQKNVPSIHVTPAARMVSDSSLPVAAIGVSESLTRGARATSRQALVQPTLRLTPGHEGVQEASLDPMLSTLPPGPDSPHNPSSPHLLTDEELAMLLSTDDDMHIER